MKELSIEQKARRYDEAIERAKNFIENGDERERTIAESIFAGIMEESEDERIRKWIVKQIKTYDPSNIKDKALAWLEKQGEQKPNVNDTAKEMFIKALERVEEQNTKGYKLTDCDKNSWWEDFKAYCGFSEIQKPTDKVESKFHEGDWVVHYGTENIYQVVNVIDNQYQLKYGDTYTVQNCADVDRCARLWTIKDAKNGDVLYTSSTASNEVFIFKGLAIEGYIECYCSYDSEDKYREGKYHFIGKPTFMTHPATKEQRDTLMKAMADAGYTFDFEKKELKKIEKKPANNIEPIFNVGDKIQYLKGCGTIMTIEKIENGEYIFGNNMGHTTIESGNKWYLVEQKPAWSEEDEKVIHCLEYTVKHFYEDKDTVKWCCDWLKSLRPQSTWKPSDEQMEQLKKYCPDNRPLTSLYEQLKKLKG